MRKKNNHFVENGPETKDDACLGQENIQPLIRNRSKSLSNLDDKYNLSDNV